MTRINYGIPVKCLTDEHLLAEHREIKRLPKSFSAALSSGSINRVPKSFCLGKGHVLFFVDKPRYTLSRYIQIYRECIRRGFDVTAYSHNWDVYSDKWFRKSIRPTENDRNIIVERITERITASSKQYFHYYGERINKATAIKLLKV